MSPEKMTVDEIKKAMDCRESPCSEVSLKNCRDCFMREREDHEKEQEAREAAEARAEDLKEKNKVLKGEKVAMNIRIDRLMAHAKKHDRKVYKAQAEEKDAKRKMNEATDEVERWQHKFAHQVTVIEGDKNIIEKKNKDIETLKKVLIIHDKEAAKAIEEEKGKVDKLENILKSNEEGFKYRDNLVRDAHKDLKKAREEMDEVKRIGRGYLKAIEGLKEKVLELEKETKPKKPKKAKKKRRSWLSRR